MDYDLRMIMKNLNDMKDTTDDMILAWSWDFCMRIQLAGDTQRYFAR